MINKAPKKLLRAPSGSSFRSERGTAILELAIVAPLYVLILFSIVDLGQAIRQEGIFEQFASNVGANVLGRIADLEPNTWYQNVQTGSSTPCSPSADCPGHRLVHDMIHKLRTLHGFDVGPGEEFASFNVRSRYLPFNLGNANSDVVELEVWGTYAGVLPTLARNVGVRVQYPYLYDDVPHGGFSTLPSRTIDQLPGLTDADQELLDVAMQLILNNDYANADQLLGGDADILDALTPQGTLPTFKTSAVKRVALPSTIHAAKRAVRVF